MLDQKSVSRLNFFEKSEPDFGKDKDFSNDQLKPTPKEHQKIKTRSHDKPTIFPQYRGNITQKFAIKLKNLCDLQVVFITPKIKIMPPQSKVIFR